MQTLFGQVIIPTAVHAEFLAIEHTARQPALAVRLGLKQLKYPILAWRWYTWVWIAASQKFWHWLWNDQPGS
ncbi:MAG: hypothetical protein KA362_02160 [Chloroflexi bacterium]|nr:hypothetical protein [Chloroflexota bacterium]MBP6802889.1 hypothetical protein [Chloroflexota bacterium]